VPRVALTHLAGEALVHRSRSQEDEVGAGSEAAFDLVEKSREVLEASGLARGLRRAAAAVAERRVVADVARRAPMRGDVGNVALDRDAAGGL
jgi:hypothetical protein